MDSFKVHKTEIVQEKLSSINCGLIIVPPGMMSVYQLLDIGIFGIVNPKLEDLWCAEQRNLRQTTEHRVTVCCVRAVPLQKLLEKIERLF